MTADDHGHPKHEEERDSRTETDAAQTVSLSTQQAADQLGVDSRTVRRYITEGIRAPGGMLFRLEAGRSAAKTHAMRNELVEELIIDQ